MKLPGIISLVRKMTAITLVVILALFSLSHLVNVVQAGTFSSASLTISDSRASKQEVTYTFNLTPANTGEVIKQIDIYFCTSSTGICTAPADMNTGTPTLDSDTINGTDSRTVEKIGGLNNTARVVIETPAIQDDPFNMVFTGVTNTSAENSSIFARIQSYSDTGTTLVDEATIASGILTTTSVYVTAEVGPTFSFTLTPLIAGSVNSSPITLTDTTAGEIPFGQLVDGVSKVAAHTVNVVTNANLGFLVTLKSINDPTETLKDGTNNIDSFTGSNAVPVAWDSPTSADKNVNTGFFGYTTTDITLTGGDDRFDSNLWAGPTTTAEEVMYKSSATVGTGEEEDIGWQIEINEYQPPGSYTGQMVLVATPTY